MFVLSNLTVVSIVQRRLCVDTPQVTEVLQGRAVFDFSDLLQPPSAEGQSTKVLLYFALQFFGIRVSDSLVNLVEVKHVMTSVGGVPDLALAAYATESFNGIKLVFHHLGLVLVVVKGDALASMHFLPVD